MPLADRHCRPPECGQVHALQPACGQAAGDRARHARRHARPAGRLRPARSACRSPDRHGRLRIGAPGSLSTRMTEQTLAAIKEADVCLFVINARDGVTTGDEIIADVAAQIRQAGRARREQMRRAARSVGILSRSASANPSASPPCTIWASTRLSMRWSRSPPKKKTVAGDELTEPGTKRSTGRSSSPLSAVPMSANRACSTACWAKSVR